MKKKYLIFYALSAISALLLITCAKEYSYEGGTAAQYKLDGSPDACNPVTVSGNYIEGNSVTSSEYVQLSIQVTVAGVYSITTIPADGISFTSSGNFSDTGRQSLILYCSGTPSQPGTYTFKIPGTNGCYFTVTVNKKAPASYTLSGNPNDCSNPVISGLYQQNIKTTIADSVVLTVNVNTAGTYHIVTDSKQGFGFADSGFFYNTGLQNVTLHASGAPAIFGPVSFDVTADSSQCSFIVLVDPGAPQAVYVLQSSISGNIDYCTPHIVQGTYTTNTPLNINNTITISAYIRDTGYYSIYTGKINGMSFVSTGSFSSSGVQMVVLQGSGTPLAPGDYTFAPNIIGPAPLGGNSCGFTITVQ